jgi:hypothetical protein
MMGEPLVNLAGQYGGDDFKAALLLISMEKYARVRFS